MLKYESEIRRGVSGPILWDNHRSMIGLAARAQDLISHYPDFGDSREADALIGACGRQVLDRQSNLRLDRKTEWPIRMAPAAAIQ